MDGSSGIDGTTGSKESASGQLIEANLARTQGMSSRSDGSAAVNDPYEPDDVCEEVGLDVAVHELRGLGEKPWPEWLWVRVPAEQAAQLPDSGVCRIRPLRASPPSSPAGQDGYVDFDKLPYLLTPQEAAKLLRTTVGAIYARAERGQMPGVVRQGRKLLFHRDAVRRVLDREAAGNARGSK